MTQYVLAAASWLDFSGLTDWFRSLKAKIEYRRRVRSTIKELSALTDYELNDIGIARGDIWAIAHEDKSFKRFTDTNENLKGWV